MRPFYETGPAYTKVHPSDYASTKEYLYAQIQVIQRQYELAAEPYAKQLHQIIAEENNLRTIQHVIVDPSTLSPSVLKMLQEAEEAACFKENSTKE